MWNHHESSIDLIIFNFIWLCQCGANVVPSNSALLGADLATARCAAPPKERHHVPQRSHDADEVETLHF